MENIGSGILDRGLTSSIRSTACTIKLNGTKAGDILKKGDIFSNNVYCSRFLGTSLGDEAGYGVWLSRTVKLTLYRLASQYDNPTP